MRRRRRSLSPFVLLVLVPVLLAAGIWLGGHPSNLPGPARDALVGDDESRLYDEALDRIAADYYRPIDRSKLLDASLGSAVESLNDRFSAYFDPKEYASFQETTEGAFEGVGMSVEEVKEGLRILTVFDRSPAKSGGLRPGDTITAVNGTTIKGASSEKATTMIKGPAGSSVKLTVRTGKRSRDVTLKRRRVDVPVVKAEMERSGATKVAHISLSSFTSGAHGEVGKAVRDLLDKGAKGVVLDLRDNGGGLLNEAVLISSIFIPEGKIVSTKGRARPERVFEATGRSISSKVPVVVLVNGESASASEIVTGALQDRDRATVVGTRTFGKGVFQEIQRLPNGGALDLTVGEYFTPKGRNLGGGGPKKGAGITPDVTARDKRSTPKRDEALEVAVRTLTRAKA